MRLLLLSAAVLAALAPLRAADAPRLEAARQPAGQEAPFPSLEALEREVARLVEAARPSVVGIVARAHLEKLLDSLGDHVWIEREDGVDGPIMRRISTGVVVDGDGHIVTLASAVSGATEVLVLPSEGGRLRAELKGADDYSGLAVLSVGPQGRGRTLPPVAFGDSDSLEVGSLVTAFASPAGRSGEPPIYSLGFVSGTGISPGPERRGSFLKFTAYSAPGAGGGPVFDSKGRFVGLVFAAAGGGLGRGGDAVMLQAPSLTQEKLDGGSSVLAFPGGEEDDPSLWILKSLHRASEIGGSVSYAVPSNVVRRVVDQIIRTGAVRRGWVGVKIEETEPGEARLLEVVPGSPAEKAGLKAGDRIVALNDQPLAAAALLVDAIASSAPGASVRLGIRRGGQRLDLPVLLGEPPRPRPRPGDVPRAAPAPRLRRPALGVDVDTETDDDIRRRLGAREGVGLLVLKVQQDSRAERSGVREGDLIVEALGTPIRSLLDLRRALRQQGPRTMDLEILRKGKRLVVKIPPSLPDAPAPPPPLPAPPR